MDKWGDHGEYEGIDQDSLQETPWFPYLYEPVRFEIEGQSSLRENAR